MYLIRTFTVAWVDGDTVYFEGSYYKYGQRTATSGLTIKSHRELMEVDDEGILYCRTHYEATARSTSS